MTPIVLNWSARGNGAVEGDSTNQTMLSDFGKGSCKLMFLLVLFETFADLLSRKVYGSSVCRHVWFDTTFCPPLQTSAVTMSMHGVCLAIRSFRAVQL